MLPLMLLAIFAQDPAQLAPLPQSKQDAIRRYLDVQLLDGASARWKWPKQRLSRPNIYCGWVNAKNRMGAFTGWTPYYVTFKEDGSIDAGRPKDRDGDTLIWLFCERQGYDVTKPPLD